MSELRYLICFFVMTIDIAKADNLTESRKYTEAVYDCTNEGHWGFERSLTIFKYPKIKKWHGFVRCQECGKPDATDPQGYFWCPKTKQKCNYFLDEHICIENRMKERS